MDSKWTYRGVNGKDIEIRASLDKNEPLIEIDPIWAAKRPIVAKPVVRLPVKKPVTVTPTSAIKAPGDKATLELHNELVSRGQQPKAIAPTAWSLGSVVGPSLGQNKQLNPIQGVGYIGEKALSGLGSGLEGIAKNIVDFTAQAAKADLDKANRQLGMGQSIHGLLGNKDIVAEMERAKSANSQVQSVLPQTAAALRPDVATKYAQNVEQRYGQQSGTLKTVGDIAGGIGGMVPAIASNLVVPGSGLAVMFSSAAGNAADEARKAGADENTALTYGILSGGVEVATEKLFGGIPGLNKGLFSGSALSGIAKSKAAQSAVAGVVDAFGEGAEEYISSVAGAYLEKMYRDNGKDFVQTFVSAQPEAFYSGLVGALTSGVMQGGNAAMQYNSPQAKAARADAQGLNGTAAYNDPAQGFVGEPKTSQIPQQNAADGLASPTGVTQQGQGADSGNKSLKNILAYSDSEIANIQSPRIKLMKATSDFVGFIRESLTGDGSAAKIKMYLGKVSTPLAGKIQQYTGLDLNGYNLSLSNHEIRKIVNNSHGDIDGERLRGQRPVTPQDMESILLVANDPDKIYRSAKDTDGGRPAIVFERQIGDNFVYVQYVSDKHHSLDGQTMWITKKKSPNPASNGVIPTTNAQSVQEQGFLTNPNIAQGNTGVKGSMPGELNNTSPAPAAKSKPSAAKTPPLFREGLSQSTDFNRQDYSKYSKSGKITSQNMASAAVELINMRMPKANFTKAQWLENAKQLGSRAAAGGDDVKQAAYELWFTYRPNNKENLNRQGKGFVKFDVTEFVNAFIDGALKTNPALSETKRWDAEQGKYIDFESFWFGNGGSYEEAMEGFLREADAPVNAFGESTVGAAESAFTHNVKTSKVRSNTVEKSPMFSAAEKELLETDHFRYDVVSEKQSIAEAKSRIETDFDGEVRDLSVKAHFDGTDTDTAMGIAEKYGKEALQAGKDSSEAKRYVEWVRLLQQRATESGQAVQAFAKYSRTPEGAAIKAQAIVSNAAKEYVESKPNSKMVDAYNLGAEDFIKIHKYTQTALDFPEGSYERALWSAKADRIVGSKLPKSFKKQFITAAMDSMLGNFRTLISRNAVGNLLFAIPETVKQIPAAVIDRTVSLKTGVRTRTLPGIGKSKAYWQGMRQGFTEAASDYGNKVRTQSGNEIPDMADGVKMNAEPFSDVNFFGRLANEADRLVGAMLSMGDRPFFQAAYNQRMVELKQIRKKAMLGGTVQFPKNSQTNAKLFNDEDFDRLAPILAKMDALDATFQNKGLTSEAFSSLKKGLGEFGESMLGVDILGQFAMPFPKTPGNIFERSIEYTPLGAVKNTVRTALELKNGTFDQKRFVDETSRNLLGTALFWSAKGLLAAGLITGALDKDKDKREAQYAIGMQPYSFKVGNAYYSYEWIPVVGASLVAGAAFQDAYANAEEAPLIEGSKAAISSSIRNSALQGLTRMFGGYDIATSAADTMLGGSGQFVPSMLRQAAAVGDTYQRENYDPSALKQQGNYLSAGVPFLRGQLPPKVDALGQPILQNQGRGAAAKAFENMLSPGRLTTLQHDPLYAEAFRLSEAVSEGGNAAFPPKAEKTYESGGKTMKFSAEDYYRYAVERGTLQGDSAKTFIGSGVYQSLSEDDKLQALRALYSQAGAIARKEVLGDEYAVTEQYRKSYEAYQRGISLDKLAEVNATKDVNKNGGVTQEEMESTLDRTNLTNMQRRYLFAVENKGWKKNPY